mmetsp:Transcript_19812/g.35248  ORF Transcript_19812/g.35248 Transcript_19812/m.35248 type:complete len:157 (+) Transcript_19812:1-471(+)
MNVSAADARERTGLEPHLLPTAGASAGAMNGLPNKELGWDWCLKVKGSVQPSLGCVAQVSPAQATSYIRSGSAPELGASFGPSMISCKGPHEPFFGGTRPVAFKVSKAGQTAMSPAAASQEFHGRMMGGKLAKEGWAGTSPVYGRGWRHGMSMRRF